MITSRAKRLWCGVSIAATTVSLIGLSVVAFVPQAPGHPRLESRHTPRASAVAIPLLHTVGNRPAYVGPTRNLFAFARPSRIQRARTTRVVAAPNSVTTDAPQPLRLIGLASNSEAVDADTMAIVSTEGHLVFVRQGETVTDYRVECVSDQSIVLSDVRTGALECLVLGAAAALPSAACPAVR